MLQKPITAPRETVPKDGLRGALGYGVILPEQAQTAATPAPEPQEIGGVPVPAGFPGGAALDPGATGTVADPEDPTGRWTSGFVLEGDPCAQNPYSFGMEFCAEDATTREVGQPTGLIEGLEGQRPFAIGVGVKCSTMGSPTELAPWFDAARRMLDLVRWSQIANELWTGARSAASGGSNVHLASPDATVLSSSPVPLVEGIAALEDAAGPGAVQLIHVPRKLSAYLDNASVIHTSAGSGRLWTANDSLVIADRGYPGTDPAGDVPAAGVSWIYSTGVMAARLGAVRNVERDDGDAVRYATNDRVVHVEQPAAIAWLCGHFAIPVCY